MDLNEQLDIAKSVQEEIRRGFKSVGFPEYLIRQVEVSAEGDEIALYIPQELDSMAVGMNKEDLLAKCIERGVNKFRCENNLAEGGISNASDIHK